MCTYIATSSKSFRWMGYLKPGTEKGCLLGDVELCQEDVVYLLQHTEGIRLLW